MIENEPLEYAIEISELGRHGTRRAIKGQVAFMTGGIAVWELAKERHPHERVQLRQGGRIIRDTHPDPVADYPGRGPG